MTPTLEELRALAVQLERLAESCRDEARDASSAKFSRLISAAGMALHAADLLRQTLQEPK